MNEIIFEILNCVVIICCLCITRYLIPFIKNKLESLKEEKYYNWVCDAVDWAEQTFKGSGRGPEKFVEVKTFLEELASEKNIEISDKQLDILIESVVKNL